MNRQQTLLVVLATIGVFLVIGFVAWLAGRTSTEAVTGLDPTQRFTAKPGTTREKALVLTSENRPSTGDFSDIPLEEPEEAAEVERQMMVRSLSPPSEDLSPVDLRIRQAMNNLDPAQGIAQIDAALAELQGDKDLPALHLAKARLAAYLEPPDWALAQAALDLARSQVDHGTARQEVALLSAQLAVEAGNPGIAMKHIEEGLAERTEGPMEVELLGLAGQLEKWRGNEAQAQERWEEAFAKGKALSLNQRKTIEGPLRAIALRLAQGYREAGEESSWDQIQADIQIIFEE